MSDFTFKMNRTGSYSDVVFGEETERTRKATNRTEVALTCAKYATYAAAVTGAAAIVVGIFRAISGED